MHPEYINDKAGIGQLERKILDQMSSSGKTVIHAQDLESEFGYNRKQSSLILSRLSKKGWIQRLRSGIYRIVPLGSESATPLPDDSWAIAMEVFEPCYISGWSAAEYWELTEQIFNSTVVFTCHKQRRKDQTIAGLRYRTKNIAPDYIFGTKTIWSSNKKIVIADLHRTVIDVLDDPIIGGGGRHSLDIAKAYKDHAEANLNTLIEYAERLNHGAAIKRLGFIGENIMNLSESLLERLHAKIKKGIIKFDPNGPDSGPIITKWGIRINIPLGDVS
jgi:predicted transcriptional regulator of viral defense system